MMAGLLVLGMVLFLSGVHRWLAVTAASGRSARLARRVWTPLLVGIVVCVPMAKTGHEAWPVALAVPLVVLIAVPILLLPSVLGRSGDPWDADERLVLTWPAVGVVLLLVAVAGRLPESGMLVLFTLGAVLAWSESIPRREETWGGEGTLWLAVAVTGAGALAAGLWMMDGGLGQLALPVLVAAWVLVVLTRRHGPRAGITGAMWTAALMGLAAPGMLGFQALLDMATGRPLTVTVTGVPQVGPLMVLAAPATGLLACCLLLAGVGRWPSLGRGAAVGLVLALLVGLLWGVLAGALPEGATGTV